MMRITMKDIRVALCLLLLAACALTARALDKSYYAESSKLASGKWVKIAVVESGIYQITAEDTRSWGLGGDLSQIHVFGYGGKPLSQKMQGDNYADDLPQMPIVRTGDRILFYAQGPTSWNYLNENLPQLQEQHPYANSGSYFVTNDSRFSDLDIERATNEPASDVVTTYIDRLYHEVDLVNPGETGRVYLGEDFKSTPSQTFKFDLDGLVPGSTIVSCVDFGAHTQGYKGTVIQKVNGKPLSDGNVIGLPGSHIHYNYVTTTYKFTLDGTTSLDYGIDFSCGGSVDLARLNYITINYARPLELKNGSLVFGIHRAKANKGYRLTGCGNATHVWDVTKPFALLELNAVGSEGTLTFSPSHDGRHEFVAFDESGSFPHPEFLSEVSNQDIHAEPVPDM
ncbi:MAG: hypothetical protein IKS64_02840, partial [Muribaculaceae bacterium]|nr:hypothetical protein [Muribaculaceae bacterium]